MSAKFSAAIENTAGRPHVSGSAAVFPRLCQTTAQSKTVNSFPSVCAFVCVRVSVCAKSARFVVWIVGMRPRFGPFRDPGATFWIQAVNVSGRNR